ncbi:hypothetical protein H0H92_001275 [Tricholoma furcatifolium]|nr:hypothetical protein H0H92_001275 [Tricholoma furcatifolium]
MTQGHEVWFRDPLRVLKNQLGNPDFADEIDYAPKRVFLGGKRRYRDVMSGNWAWEQCNILAEDEENHGAMFIPVILGSDKTTVSVATGQNNFYPLYASIGSVHNSVCRAHRNALSLSGFLSVPKNARHYQLISMGLWVGDAPTNTLQDSRGFNIEGTPFTDSFPHANIHELLTLDPLHQIIKGMFKDHLVDWIQDYIYTVNSESQANKIMADIDYLTDASITAAPPFPGLQHFAQGRSFKQWTENDSKGLMKVYLPAIQGHLPPDIVRTVAALIDFCYLVRRDVIDEDTLVQIDNALKKFHQYREAFREVRPEGFSLPCQHSLVHYIYAITQFGTPNGLCSSITESKHIKAVKQPYRRSNKNNPLGQMLITNQRMSKLEAARIDFTTRGMLPGSSLPLALLFGQDTNATIDRSPPVLPQIPLLAQPQNSGDGEDGNDAGEVQEPQVLGPKSMLEISLAKSFGASV